MVPRTRLGRCWPSGLVVLTLALGLVPRTEAQDDYGRRGRVAYPTAAVARPCPPPTLGTFEPTPYMWVNGNAPASGGLAPLDQFGDTTLTLYGPLSSLRATAAPVLSYQRGYDGRTVIQEGTSFSYPNLPGIAPVIYPTQATYYYGFRNSRTPPWWKSAVNWIDQN